MNNEIIEELRAIYIRFLKLYECEIVLYCNDEDNCEFAFYYDNKYFLVSYKDDELIVRAPNFRGNFYIQSAEDFNEQKELINRLKNVIYRG